jgi:enoyl-CoA hydratase/carnithine racemase
MAAEVRAGIVDPGVGEIVIDVPPRNVLGPGHFGLLEAALADLRASGARVVVVTSAVEGAFIGHGSLEGIISFFSGGGEAAGDVGAQQRVLRELDRGPMISIAAVDGQAWGGGAELCWCCDLRVASRSATFAQPEVTIGLVPGWGGATRIARMAGEATALRLVLDGRPVDGAEAARLGLVHQVTEEGRARDDALGWARRLVDQPPGSLAAVKDLVKGARPLSLRDALRRDLDTFVGQASRPEVLDLVRAAQARYDEGGDSYDAFGLPRPG